MAFDDTILAVSSPRGGDGIRAIVRLSGPRAWELAGRVMAAPVEEGAGWRAVRVAVGEVSVAAGLLLFRGPRSFTGQDVAELHVPNSPALVGLLLEALAAGGARMAEPGEFTARAFFAGKVDLTEAEGIAATIAAGNAAQLRAAAGLREGDLHRWIAHLADELGNLLALIEAGIDFADEEDVSFVSAGRVNQTLRQLRAEIERERAAAVRIDRLALPPTVVFVGMPNVGKSSLINALSGSERSIVSAVAGTTRDILAVGMAVPGGAIRLLDVPGEEEATDELRTKMMAARDAVLLDADLVVEVTDDPAVQPAMDAGPMRVTVWNKCDLFDTVEGAEAWQVVSARTGAGIESLRAALTQRVTAGPHAGAERLVLNHRHRALLAEAAEHLEAAQALTEMAAPAVELVAADIRRALDALGQVTGTISPDEVLGRIFSRFCIGK